MPRIIDTTDPNYIAYRKIFHPKGSGSHNGAYYYSQEIVKNIIPNVKTNRPWNTLGMEFAHAGDHAITFIHHNIKHDQTYRHLLRFHDLVYICSTPITYEWAKHRPNGHAIYLPLSIDVDYVKQFRVPKTKDTCYMGNRWAFKRQYEDGLPDNVEFPPQNLPREELLKWVAPYRKCYAIGRCALEAKILGAEILPFYPIFPDPSFWKVIDNKDAAKILQHELDLLDGPHDKPNKKTYPSPEPSQ